MSQYTNILSSSSVLCLKLVTRNPNSGLQFFHKLFDATTCGNVTEMDHPLNNTS